MIFFLEQSFGGLRSAWAMHDMIHEIALLGVESEGLHSFHLLSLFLFEWSTGFSELYLTKRILCYFR